MVTCRCLHYLYETKCRIDVDVRIINKSDLQNQKRGNAVQQRNNEENESWRYPQRLGVDGVEEETRQQRRARLANTDSSKEGTFDRDRDDTVSKHYELCIQTAHTNTHNYVSQIPCSCWSTKFDMILRSVGISKYVITEKTEATTLPNILLVYSWPKSLNA